MMKLWNNTTLLKTNNHQSTTSTHPKQIKQTYFICSQLCNNNNLVPNQDVVDRDADQFHKEANESHDEEANVGDVHNDHNFIWSGLVFVNKDLHEVKARFELPAV